MPQLTINTPGNSSFYFDKTPLEYAIDVKDNEDAKIDSQNLKVTLEYVPKDAGTWKPSSKGEGVWITPGKTIIQASDCKACHRFDTTVIGPAFIEVSKRYQGKPNEIPRLASKIITGGAGVWGNHYMNAHPQLSKDDAVKAVKYILSLTQQKTYDSLAAKGTMNINPSNKEEGGSYVLSASYTDLGNGVVPLTGTKQLVLRSSKVEAKDADIISDIERNKDQLQSIHNRSYFVLKNIDLKDIKQVTYKYASKDIGAALEVHINSPKGDIISVLNYQNTGDWKKFREATAAIKDPGGKHDLYFVFKKDTEPNNDMFALDWLEFER